MRNFLFLPLLLAVVAFGLAVPGCVIADDLQESVVATPTAEVLDVALTGQTPDGASLAAVVEVTNPNSVELPLVDLSVRFRVDGMGTFSSADQPTVALPPQGSQRMRFTAALPTGGTDPSGRAFSFSATMTYQPPGELRQIFSESGVPRPFVIASADGTLGEPLN